MATWHFMTSQNCFPAFCAVRNFLFPIFLFHLAFGSKDVLCYVLCVMCNLNSKGDSTIKLLNLDLFYKGGIPILCSEFFQIQNVISQLIFEILKNFFSAFNFPWIVLSKTKEKIGRIKSLKFTYEWRQQMWRHNLTFSVILSAILIGLMFCIFRPSLVGKELKQASYFKLIEIVTFW